MMNKILLSIIAHIFNNSITFIALRISLVKIESVQSIFTITYMFVGISALILFIKIYRKDFIETIKEDARILKTYEKVKYSFSGVWALIYIASYVVFVFGLMIFNNVIKN